jgi:SAM-dependent methyltransferase
MYDGFSADYDRFVNWPERLAVELPFIVGQIANGLGQSASPYVLDVACGTGMHAIALAQRGYEVVGADLSGEMIERARANARAERAAAAAGMGVRFEVAGFGELAEALTPERAFDAVLCLGNSLPHLLTPDDLAAALADFAACLRPEGLLLIQNRNFDAVLARGERWMPLQACREGDREWLFLRFYDFESDGTLTFNVVTLRREEEGNWSQRLATTRLWPLQREELVAALEAAGFGEIVCWGDVSGASFDPASSGNLIITARRRKK